MIQTILEFKYYYSSILKDYATDNKDVYTAYIETLHECDEVFKETYKSVLHDIYTQTNLYAFKHGVYAAAQSLLEKSNYV